MNGRPAWQRVSALQYTYQLSFELSIENAEIMEELLKNDDFLLKMAGYFAIEGKEEAIKAVSEKPADLATRDKFDPLGVMTHGKTQQRIAAALSPKEAPWITQGLGVVVGVLLMICIAIITAEGTTERLYESCMTDQRVDGKSYFDEAEAWSASD